MRDLIPRILNDSIDTFLPEIWPVGGNVLPATKSQFEKIGTDVNAGNLKSGELGLEYAKVWRALGHITVNPQRRENTSSLRYSYVFGDKPAIDPHVWDPVNTSDASRKKFLQTLISKAAAYRSHYLDKTKNKFSDTGNGFDLPGHSILCGPRGSGKTFFLNHLLSRHSHSLDSERIIWVRLNMTRPFGTDASLTERIYAQVTKILLRYYDSKSEFCPPHRKTTSLAIPIGSLIDDYIQNAYENSNDKDRIDAKWRALKASMQSHGAEPSFEPANYPANLCRYVYDTALKHGLGFIIVLDGLDCLDYVPEVESRYKELLIGCEALTQGEDLFGATFVFVVRDTSSEMHRILTPLGAHNRSKTSKYQICTPSIFSIVRRRLDLLKKRLKKSPSTISTDAAQTWSNHLDAFFKFLSESTGDKLERLDFAGENRRSAMQLVQANYRLYLNDKSTQDYKLTEVLCTKGELFPSLAYTYQHLNNTWLRHAVRLSGFDSNFLPRLLGSPYVQDQMGVPKSSEFIKRHFLAPLRVMQYLCDFNKPNAALQPKSGNQVITVMSKFFDYDGDAIRAIIEEYALYECICFVGGERVTGSDLDTCRLTVTPKGLSLISQYFSDVAYLALYSMLVPKAESTKKIPSISVGTPFGSKNERHVWVTTKILNALTCARLVVCSNTHEKSKYLSKAKFFDKGGDPMALSYQEGKRAYFSFIEAGNFIKDVEHQLSAMFASIPDLPGWKGIPEQIKSYGRCWTTLNITDA